MNKDLINTANELEILQVTKGKGADALNKKLMAKRENEKKPINPKEIFAGINKSKIKNSKYRQNRKFNIDPFTNY
jgi:hypothetical protein